MDKPLRLSAVALLTGLLAAGCSAFCTHDKCVAPSLIVAVTDAETGASLTAAQIDILVDGQPLGSADDFTCGDGCRSVSVIGKVHVTISAQGYAGTSFDAQIDKDVCGRAVGVRRDVALPKLGTTRQALVNEGEGPKQCGQ